MKVPLSLLLLAVTCSAFAANYTVYVRPKTQDAAYEAEMGPGNGTKEKPFYAIQLALADVAKKRGDRMAEIVLTPGVYRQGGTIELMSFGEKGGIIRSETAGSVVLTDGQILTGDRFRPVADASVRARLPAEAADRVLVADLAGMKLSLPDVTRKREMNAPLPLPDVVVDGRRFYPAKWPNDGWARIRRYTDAGAKYQKGKEIHPGATFEYADERPARWVNAPYVWLQGYWSYDWNERVLPVEKIVADKRQIQLSVPYEYGVPKASDNATPRRWRALHLLEELDAPGEFYLDVTNRKLYLLPGTDWKGGKSEVTLSTEWRSLVFAKNTPNIALRNLTFRGSFGIMANFTGCRNLFIQNCSFSGGRDCALALAECPNARVSECSFHDLGSGALRASAGDRRTLTSGGIVIENNEIRDCGQLAQNCLVTDLAGVGLVFRHNLVENVPHIAMRLGGNDHVIEYNVFRNCCRETDDASVIYKGRDPSCTGNLIRWNFFDEAHSIHASNLGTSAVYFDDGDCGDTVYGCVFRKCGPSYAGRDGKRQSMGCVFSHWGFEAHVDNCLFIDCGAAVSSAPCNDEHWKKTIASMTDKLRNRVDVEGDVYTAHYPWIRGLTTPQPGMRRDNFATRCAVVNGELPPRGAWVTNETYVTFAGDPGFVDAAHGDYTLRPDSEVYRKIPTFDAIPFGKIGPLRKANGRSQPQLQFPAEFDPRGGLGHVLEKIRAGREITVAYFGGSITEMGGWRNLSLDWLRKRYPKARFREVNAAIGGTDSTLGVFRYGHDVLSQKPDLVFVEFATNDSRGRPECVMRNFDGFIRQTWKLDPQTDFVFTYTVTKETLPHYLAGRRPPVTEAMETVANHYGIPTVDFGWQIADEVKAGRLVMSRGEVATAVPTADPDADRKVEELLKARGQTLFARDGVHPALSGHRLYMKSFERLWTALEGISSPASAARPKRPCRTDDYLQAKMVPIEPLMLKGEGWERLPKDNADQKAFGARAGQLWHCARPGGRLCFSFLGSVCKIYDLLGPDGAQVYVTVDGVRRAAAVPRFDSYCSYRRLAEFVVYEGTPGVHSVEIEIAAEQPSRLPLKKRHPEIDITDPKYDGTSFFPAQIMLVGEIVAGRDAFLSPLPAGSEPQAAALPERIHSLRYAKPAADSIGGWEQESLPIGNGWFGASVFGGRANERIQITHNAVHVKGRGKNRSPLSTLTDALEIRLRFPDEIGEGYERGLDLETGVAWVRGRSGGSDYRREYFASYPDRVLVMRLTASRKGVLKFALEPQIPFLAPFSSEGGDPAVGRRGTVSASGTGIAVDQELEAFGIRFAGRLAVVSDGTVRSEAPGALSVSDATEAVVLFVCDTNYRLRPETFSAPAAGKLDPSDDPGSRAEALLARALGKGYAALRRDHERDFAGLMGRVAVDFGGGGDDAKTPTDELLTAYSKGRASASLEETYFQYGRYLLVSSSRPGTLPANLQGIWTAHEVSPWGAGYWHNINVQMNYWPAFVANLAECFEAYAAFNAAFRPTTRPFAVDYLKEHGLGPLPRGGEAPDMWCVGTVTYPYGVLGGPGGHSGPGTIGLTTKLFADWWDYTRDREALEKYVWPTIHGAAEFLTRCVTETNGLYLSAFSASPEQMVKGLEDHFDARKDKVRYYTTVGCAFDQQMICENGRDLLRLAKILGKEDDPLVRLVRKQIDRYDPVQVGADGQLKEYREEVHYGDFGQWRHRHISQLVGLYPGTLVTKERPEWMDAARYSLTQRGDDSTGWALAHRLNCWARLGDGEHCHLLIRNLLGKRTYPNLWDSHPPFQIDGNFGATSGICEMLVQSQAGYVDLLPALPKAWAKKGSFKGLCARGRVTVDCEWLDGRPVRVRITAPKGERPEVRFAGKSVDEALVERTSADRK